MSREELIELVRMIHKKCANGSGEEVLQLVNTFCSNVPHRQASDLIFWPPNGRELSPEEIVDIALNYRPILL